MTQLLDGYGVVAGVKKKNALFLSSVVNMSTCQRQLNMIATLHQRDTEVKVVFSLTLDIGPFVGSPRTACEILILCAT